MAIQGNPKQQAAGIASGFLYPTRATLKKCGAVDQSNLKYIRYYHNFPCWFGCGEDCIISRSFGLGDGGISL